ncbi:lactate racemase domain-containing protein [Fusibacillus kribbianus]|uniref:Lactate racemase domain-containing protein n=1 Tax=Fusibacillus kribbianus TaxID=3044208 RepID=A0AAP4B8X4_9FIRM|nr:lactate racemase domain-containing protein [Ruminococcus sp. YH-rum2234]MDI9241730.1 lactate racemase domain-containing protein [Ruminococcus sp. YH-rum2234]
MELYLEAERESGLTEEEIKGAVQRSSETFLRDRELERVLIIPPDFTRFYSNAGQITKEYYHAFIEKGCQVDILPALGSHEPMTREQFSIMYGDIPYEKMLVHHWRKDVTAIGEVPASYMKEITEGLWEEPLKAEVSRLLLDPGYDLILSIGQVVPHEVVGMSNHSKNIFVGTGGSDMINKSHMVGAVYGMERMMGKDYTPVRKAFDYALEHFLKELPLVFVLTVTTAPMGKIQTHGLFIGEKRDGLERAVALSQKKNIDFVEKGMKKCVVYLDPSEFHSTWLGNKAVYRTRMAMADGGELLILAPGVRRFGEDDRCDELIRKYGYCGRLRMLELYRKESDLRENMAVSAHLIHGSSDGRFTVTYAVRDIAREEIEAVGYRSADYEEAVKRYDPEKLHYGWNVMEDGEEIFYVPNPAIGLWIDRNRF